VSEETTEQAEERRRRERRERIFGEVLPESTEDDSDSHPPDRERDQDAWLRGQVPPHHG
jgi:hypothetical protein